MADAIGSGRNGGAYEPERRAQRGTAPEGPSVSISDASQSGLLLAKRGELPGTGGAVEGRAVAEFPPAQLADSNYESPGPKCQQNEGGRAHCESSERAMPRDVGLFPPGPADRDAWRGIIAARPELAPAVESEVRGVAAGAAGGMDFKRQDQLRSLGNLVVPVQGAAAFLLLLKRATVQI
jgi:hypothetical protein